MDFDLINTVNDKPMVTVIITTFNREQIVMRAIKSVLSQTYKNIELIIIDDGSTDDTQKKISESYSDSRIKLYKHEVNKGVTAAKNSGLNQIKGEWFTFLDSDDEMKPEAIETMMKIPLMVDPTVTAVTCNCQFNETIDFSGKGLTKDQYIDSAIIMTTSSGFFWGVTKTTLLEGDRFNESLNGFESTLWYKINDRAKRYYIHQALNIIHTEGSDRVTKWNQRYHYTKEIKTYENVIREKHYLSTLKKYRPKEYQKVCRAGLVAMKINKSAPLATEYYKLLRSSKKSFGAFLIYKFRLVSLVINQYMRLKSFLRPQIYKLIKK